MSLHVGQKKSIWIPPLSKWGFQPCWRLPREITTLGFMRNHQSATHLLRTQISLNKNGIVQLVILFIFFSSLSSVSRKAKTSVGLSCPSSSSSLNKLEYNWDYPLHPLHPLLELLQVKKGSFWEDSIVSCSSQSRPIGHWNEKTQHSCSYFTLTFKIRLTPISQASQWSLLSGERTQTRHYCVAKCAVCPLKPGRRSAMPMHYKPWATPTTTDVANIQGYSG